MASYKIYLSDYFYLNSIPACVISNRFTVLKSNTAFDNAFREGQGELDIGDLVSQKTFIELQKYVDGRTKGSVDSIPPLRTLPVVCNQDLYFEIHIDTVKDANAYYLYFIKKDSIQPMLKERMMMYESIIQNNWDAILCADSKGKLLFANDSALTLYGYSESELLGKNIDIFTSKGNDTTKEIVKAMQGLGAFHGKVIHEKKDRSLVHCDLKMEYVFDSTGTPFGIITSCKDISKEKEAEGIIAKSDQQADEFKKIQDDSRDQVERLRIYQDIIENNWDSIVFSNLKGEIIFSNESTQKIYGYSDDDLQEKNIDIFNSKKSDHAQKMVGGLKEVGGWSGEVLHQKKTGEIFHILLTVSMVFNDQGQPFALISTAKDITERVAAELDAEQKNKELNRVKDQFVVELEAKVDERTSELRVAQEKSDLLLLNILPTQTAHELKEKGSATPMHYDQVSVLFTDFVGFTRISENLSPVELIEYLGFFFSEFDAIISRNNLEKIKTIGDAYMCAGGLPVENKTHARDAVRAGLEIQKFVASTQEAWIQKGQEPWKIRVGIHTGPVVAGVVGSKKFAYDIWGDAVNIASRVESSSEVGCVNVSDSTYELIKNDFECSYRGHISVKNKSDIEMYFVNKEKSLKSSLGE